MAEASFAFGHIADAHVGAWPRDRGVRRALRESVLRALEVVSDRNLEFLLISGDLFHTPVPDPEEVAPVAGGLRRLVDEGRRVYAIYGSHDYVAQRTSWLDVLARSGVFIRTSEDPVRPEGERWTLPFHVDGATGARIAGISGRSHGLDRSYFRSVDSEKFRSEPGFKIFQFHAGVTEYLPPRLRDHVAGVSRADLPAGCQYYAGGHIHYSYTGEGPDGGLLVNPGAVFGTSLPDLRNAVAGQTHQGIVVVNVVDGRPRAEFVGTAPTRDLEVFDVDLEGRPEHEARTMLAEAIRARARPGALLFPRVYGTLADGSLAGLGLHESALKASGQGAESVHWDVQEVSSPSATEDSALPSVELAESRFVEELLAATPAGVASFLGEQAPVRLGALLRDLGTGLAEGQSKQDYETQRIEAALRLLALDSPAGAD